MATLCIKQTALQPRLFPSSSKVCAMVKNYHRKYLCSYIESFVRFTPNLGLNSNSSLRLHAPRNSVTRFRTCRPISVLVHSFWPVMEQKRCANLSVKRRRISGCLNAVLLQCGRKRNTKYVPISAAAAFGFTGASRLDLEHAHPVMSTNTDPRDGKEALIVQTTYGTLSPQSNIISLGAVVSKRRTHLDCVPHGETEAEIRFWRCTLQRSNQDEALFFQVGTTRSWRCGTASFSRDLPRREGLGPVKPALFSKQPHFLGGNVCEDAEGQQNFACRLNRPWPEKPSSSLKSASILSEPQRNV